MADRDSLTTSRLTSLLRYDAEDGRFTWLVDRTGGIKAGDAAGSVNKRDGYVRISIDGVDWLGHVLAWWAHHGVRPVEKIDHRDGVRHRNAILNLRPATNSQNLQNQRGARVGSASGLLGVSWESAMNKWRADITTDGCHKFLGFFDDKHEAHAVYLAAKAVLHPFQTLVAS